MEPKDWISVAMGSVAITLSMISLWLSVATSRAAICSNAYSQVMEMLSRFVEIDLERPAFFEQLHLPYSEDAVKHGGRGLSHYLFMLFNLYAGAHTLHVRYGVLDAEQWRIWERRLVNDFRQREFLRGYWQAELSKYPEEYTPAFRNLVTRALDEAGRGDPLTLQR